MGTKSFGVDEKGLILTIGQAIELFKKSGKGLIEKGYINDLEDIDNDIYYIIMNMGITYYGEIDGEILSLDRCETKRYLEYEDVIIFLLMKDTLYDSYKNEEEIHNELYDTLRDYGLDVDMEFIKNNIGILNATYVS